jgi:probable rRNA maturation factor
MELKDSVMLRKRVPGLSKTAMTSFVKRARQSARLEGTVSVLVTSSREMQSLNRRFRRKNKATDVLSFPSDRDLNGNFAGDIAISAEIAAANARRLKHSTAEEIKILVLHGVLHLARYDHESDNGEMARKELRLRKSLKLPVGLIERQNATGRTAHARPNST